MLIKIWIFISRKIPRYIICSWFGHSWNDGSVAWFKGDPLPIRYRYCKICGRMDEGQIEEVKKWRLYEKGVGKS